MSKQYQKLLTLLKELFQTNEADLDFGMYKVINQRRDEINKYLDNELLTQIKAAFSKYQSMDKKSLEVELAEVIKGAEKLGIDPDTVPKVQAIREKVATYSVDVDDLENQVYSALFNFFRRYYDNGDFISQRRYKEGVYAIPYEGEEVKLYWANYDQYYIKTSEYLRDYTFKLPSGNKAHFKLVEADIEKDNRKETDDKKRRFILAEEPLIFEDGEISILFEFRPDEEKRAQNKLNEQAVETIIGLREQINDRAIKDALAELAILSPTESDKNRTLLAKHLEDYTRRNTQDYFIHKDLGKFLRRELDFFIKNEIMDLDNIENEDAPKVEQKLWLKKKFVVETNYCITLDQIPEEFFTEIVSNDAQREEWVRLFAIDEIQANGDMFKVSYSEPLTIEFLKQNPFLLVDTKYFDEDLKFLLLSKLKNLDEELDGLLIHSENFQALNLIKRRFNKMIKTIYIDPPYNAKSTEILYKNAFKHSSWLTMMVNRVELAATILKENDGVFITAIDENEQERLGITMNFLFPNYEKTCITVVHNPAGIQGKNFSYMHEYAYFVFPDLGEIIGKTKREKDLVSPLRDWGNESERENAS
ncbi:site-specific DNA-methyltransferase, partial [bacterium]|nr:site-specific DNA-methyltransferase [bacterium]